MDYYCGCPSGWCYKRQNCRQLAPKRTYKPTIVAAPTPAEFSLPTRALLEERMLHLLETRKWLESQAQIVIKHKRQCVIDAIAAIDRTINVSGISRKQIAGGDSDRVRVSADVSEC